MHGEIYKECSLPSSKTVFQVSIPTFLIHFPAYLLPYTVTEGK